MGVAGEITLVGEVVISDERLTFTPTAESRVFDGEEGGDRVAVVKLDHVHVVGLEVRHGKCRCSRSGDGRMGKIRSEGWGLVSETLPEAGD